MIDDVNGQGDRGMEFSKGRGNKGEDRVILALLYSSKNMRLKNAEGDRPCTGAGE